MPLNNPGASTAPLSSPAPASPSMRGFTAPVTPEFDTCIWGCEVPIGLCVAGIAVVQPSVDFLDEGLFVGNAAVEALGRLDAEFRLRQIEPTTVLWRVVPFEALDQPPGFCCRKGFVE